MSIVANKQTTGLWWTPEGFIDAVCHHDHTVHSLVPSSKCHSSTLFLPAPVDLHVHGGGGHDCMKSEAAIRGTLKAHALHGSGALLATSVTAPFQETSDFINNAARVMQTPDEDSAALLGVHLEGPFINPDKLGAQPPHATEIDLQQLEAWLTVGIVKVVTFAPELDPCNDLIALCHKYNVRAQIGHTLCSWHQASEALAAGCGVTHLYNAMSGIGHRGGGAATAALAYADFAEIIIDGLHVDRAAFDLAKRAIPNLYSVTDGTAASGMPDGKYTLGSLSVTKSGDHVLLPDGTTAGSSLTQRRVISVLREWDVDWHTIGAMLSAIPAQWIQHETLGRISPGAQAQWLEIEDDEPVAIWLSGERFAWR